MTTKIALLACLASTLYMTGVIAVVHVVHYPLFARVDPAAFPRYHSEHTRLIGLVVILPMTVELVTSGLLIVCRPDGTSPGLALAGLAAALATWIVTAVWSVPSHDRLALGFDATAHRTLVWTNGLRALGWLAHSVIVLVMTGRALR